MSKTIKVSASPLSVRQDFYDELINGLSTQQERQARENDKSRVILDSKQRTFFFKRTLPIILAAQRKQGLLERYFYDLQKKHVEKKRNELLSSFLILSIVGRIFKDDQQVGSQQQERSTLGKIRQVYGAYSSIKRVSSIVKGARELREKIRTETLRYKNIDVEHQGYQLQSRMYQHLHELQYDLESGVQTAMTPIYREMYYWVDNNVSIGATMARLFWWIIRQVFFFDPNDVVSIIAWVVSLVATLYTGPAVWILRLAKVANALKFINVAKKIKRNAFVLRSVLRPLAKSRTFGYLRNATRARLWYNIAQGVYTGIDLYHTDADDVEMMKTAYRTKLTPVRDRTVGRLAPRLRKIGQDTSFVQNAIHQVNEDLRNSIIFQFSGSSVALKRLSRKYNTLLKINGVTTEKITSGSQVWEKGTDVWKFMMDILTNVSLRIRKESRLLKNLVERHSLNAKKKIFEGISITKGDYYTIIDVHGKYKLLFGVSGRVRVDGDQLNNPDYLSFGLLNSEKIKIGGGEYTGLVITSEGLRLINNGSFVDNRLVHDRQSTKYYVGQRNSGEFYHPKRNKDFPLKVSRILWRRLNGSVVGFNLSFTGQKIYELLKNENGEIITRGETNDGKVKFELGFDERLANQNQTVRDYNLNQLDFDIRNIYKTDEDKHLSDILANIDSANQQIYMQEKEFSKKVTQMSKLIKNRLKQDFTYPPK